jgi:hypothetical protein
MPRDFHAHNTEIEIYFADLLRSPQEGQTSNVSSFVSPSGDDGIGVGWN